MKIVIIDDEPAARRLLREELELVADVDIVGEAEDGLSALERIGTLAPDVVFLDLQMPGMGGFEVVSELGAGPSPVVVIVTAFDQFAVRAFDAGAVDYLLKPIGTQRLLQSLEKARQILGSPRQATERMEQLREIADSAPSARPRKVVGRSGEEYFLLSTEEVLAFQADGDLVWIITAKRKFQAMQTLRVLQERLQNHAFQRVHRNALVNVNHVRKMSPMSSQRWLLTLDNNQEFIVSKRQASAVRDILSW